MRGDLGVPEAIALIVVIARYLEPFAALGELTPGIETATTVLRRLRAVLDAPRSSKHVTVSAEMSVSVTTRFLHRRHASTFRG